MNNRRLCPALLLVPMLAVVGLAAFPVHAAGDPSAHSLGHAPGSSWISLVLAAFAALALVGRGRRQARRGAICSLALLVALFALEAVVHSVHHLDAPDAAASCAVLAASQHAVGTCDEPPGAVSPVWTAEPLPVVDVRISRPLQAFDSYEGRAPPTVPAV
jgi:hypothetical protein